MNATQRKQARKQKRLINLGRDAAVHIAAAEAGAQHALDLLANRDAVLSATLGKAKTLEEAVMLARVEATKVQAARDEETRQHRVELAALEDAHKLTMATTVFEMEQKHERKRFEINGHWIADQCQYETTIQNLRLRMDELEEKAEEPAKLRRRLAEKQKHIEELQTEVSQLKLRVAPESVHVPFINRRKAQ